MSLRKIICRNLLFFRRPNLGVLLAAVLCAVVLTGALTIGDSVRSTLRDIAEKRIGKGEVAILFPDGFFQENLAVRIQGNFKNKKVSVAPLVLTRGTLSSPDGSIRVSNVQVLGVDERFWRLAPNLKDTPIGKEGAQINSSSWNPDTFFVNQRLGKRLNHASQARLILRMEEPSLFSRDAPLSGERDNKFISMNQELGEIIAADGFGSFGLQGNQNEPLTVFVSLQALQKKLFRSLDEVSGNVRFANFLLIGGTDQSEGDIILAKEVMNKCWSLSDAGIEIKELPTMAEWSIRTRQVFLSDRLVSQAKRVSKKSAGVLTYLVNAIEKKKDKNESALIPYSMISAVEPQSVDFLQGDWEDDSIALNQWAAHDLNASLGDSISLSYYTVGERRKLVESSREFILKKILPMPDLIAENQESDWTPRFPGLRDAESCGEWDTGIPIVHEVRTEDEDYWDEFRGTPKGFVSLQAGQEMWGNRWGSLTGLRISKSEGSQEEIAGRLRKVLGPEDAGLIIRDLKADALDSTESPVDFGQLFIGFSFFVILAALAITGMIFTFSMEQRSQQIGLLQALGLRTRTIRFIFLGEGLLISIMGAALGVFLASSYGKIILNLLSGQWSGAVSGTSFIYDATLFSMMIGGISATLICFLAMVGSTRKLFKLEPRELLQPGAEIRSPSSTGIAIRWKRYRWAGLLCLLLSVLLVYTIGFSSSLASMAFFGAGALVLLGGLFLVRAQLAGKAPSPRGISGIAELNRRNMGRRMGRSLVTVGAMAAGTFLVVSTGAFRKADNISTEDFDSGTGGFAYWGESATPIYDDLNGVGAIELYDLNKSLVKDTKIIPLRLRDGDDASCLNLNKALRPKIFGVNLSDFKNRFQFADGNWSSLNRPISDGVVPAIVDQNTLLWALKKSLGDRIQFTNGEGIPFEVELVGSLKGSMLQGALLIKEEDFLNKFTQQGGYRSFLLAGKKEDANKVARHLEDRMYQYGIEFRESGEKLAELQRVENTYLSIFQGLGGLGMLIGTCGLGLVVVRNLMERSQEFALFEALGFELMEIRKQVFYEHAKLAFWGIALGSFSAVIGIAPALIGGGMEGPDFSFLWFFAALACLAFLWIRIAVFLTLRVSQLQFLRNE